MGLTRGDDGAIWAWIGTYGSGPLLTRPDTHEVEDFPSLTVRFTRSTPATDDWGRDGAAIYDEGYTTWLTMDHGATWSEIAADSADDGEVSLARDVKGVALSPDTTTDPFLVASAGYAAQAFEYSEDLGEDWAPGTQEPVCDAPGLAITLSPRWPDENRAFAGCGGKIYESDDRARTWTLVGDTGGTFIFTIAEADDGALVVGADNGLWRVAGGVVGLGFSGDVVDGVATTGDTILALVPAQGWFRSEDDGATWTKLAAPTTDVARSVAFSPDYADDGMLAVAGYGGAWYSTDRGDSWAPMHPEDVYDSNHDAWITSGTWSEAEWPGASGGEVLTAAQPGAVRELKFKGIAAALAVPTNAADGTMSVTFDGGEPEELTLPPRPAPT